MKERIANIMTNYLQWELQPLFGDKATKGWLIFNLIFLGTLFYSTLLSATFIIYLIKEKK